MTKRLNFRNGLVCGLRPSSFCFNPFRTILSLMRMSSSANSNANCDSSHLCCVLVLAMDEQNDGLDRVLSMLLCCLEWLQCMIKYKEGERERERESEEKGKRKKNLLQTDPLFINDPFLTLLNKHLVCYFSKSRNIKKQQV